MKRLRRIAVTAFIIWTLTTCAYARDYCFPRQSPCVPFVESLINHAQTSIDVAMFSLTSRPLAWALVRAAQRGVRVRVVLDDGQARSRWSKYRFLVKRGIPVKLDNRSAYMHHKFAVIDGKLVITGSYNWTASAEKRNDENLVVLRMPEFVRAFEGEFERLWNSSVGW